eukprot:2795747-Karenia_brevis.AAC.1
MGHWVGDAECKKSKKTKFSGIADIGTDHGSADGKEEDCQCITATLGSISQVGNDESDTTSAK